MSKSLVAAGAAIAGTVGFLALPGAVAQAAPAPATSASPRLIGPAFAPASHALAAATFDPDVAINAFVNWAGQIPLVNILIGNGTGTPVSRGPYGDLPLFSATPSIAGL